MNRLRLILIIAALPFLGSLVFFLTRSKEPKYQGRTLTEWLTVQMISNYNRSHAPEEDPEWVTSKYAIQKIGTNGIPTLLQLLQTTDSRTRMELNRLLNRQTLIRFRFKTASYCNSMGARGFEILGHYGKSAAPVLLQLVESSNEDRRFEAVDSLFSVSDDKTNKDVLLPLLLKLLHDKNPRTSGFAALYLRFHFPDEAQNDNAYKKFIESTPPMSDFFKLPSAPSE